MMTYEYKVSEVKFRVGLNKKIKELFMQKYALRPSEVLAFKVLKKSIDARDKNAVMFNYQIYVQMSRPIDNKWFVPYTLDEIKLDYPIWRKTSPVVVGFGPAGMFAALYLARCQAKPIIIERGSKMEQRKTDVDSFLKNKILNPESNVVFGEGGAGTFSDGKLTTNLNDPLIRFILNELVHFGAKDEILYEPKPHIGTDYLEKIVVSIRQEIEQLGGSFYFNTCFTDYEKEKNQYKIYTNTAKTFLTNDIFLCLGHSARDTIKMLYDKGLKIEPKNFSMGVRIEHHQKDIDIAQYGTNAALLKNASYKLNVHLPKRNVYTFCMCPGGYVMASTNNANSIVTNGMSYNKRDGINANSALLVDVNVADYYESSPLDGMRYQEKYEKLAFAISKDYRAPANLVKEFLSKKVATEYRSIVPTYPMGVVFTDFNRCLPSFVVDALREGIRELDRKMRGFANPDAVLTGIESRSSSPVRILRNEDYTSSAEGIYPIGEGAGYAGGITSAALDGLKCAMRIAGGGK